MTDKQRPRIKRRDFLVSAAGLAGTAVTRIGWSAQPCPPPLLAADGGSSAGTACQSAQIGQYPTLVLTSSAPSGVQPWTFGQPFVRGGVMPGNLRAQSGAQSFQVDIRNLWDDGSIKFAVISGTSSFAGSPLSVVMGSSGTLTSSGSVAEPNVQASVQFSSPAATVELATARANGQMGWSKNTAHRVRALPGSVMSEFHYYSPVPGDAHLSVWWFVRAYSTGAVEVESVVENGWLQVAAPGQRSYTVSVAVGDSIRFGPSALSHLHHTRWSRTDWVGSNPAVVPAHNGSYLRATKLVPNYTTNYGAPSATTLNALPQTLAPFARGLWPSNMGDAGSGGALMNNWDALYVTSQDPRAFRSAIAHAESAGRYGIFYRDETTGNPPLFASYTGLCYDGSGISDTGSGLTYTPTASGTNPPNYAKSHAVSFGYLAYLLTGRHSFRELVEFQAQICNFATTNTHTFEGSRVVLPTSGAWTLRGWAWAIRSSAAAVVCVPDNDPRALQHRTLLGKSLSYQGDRYTGRNSLGLLASYTNYSPGDGTSTGFWQEDYATVACAFAKQVAADALTGADRSRSEAFINWRMLAVVGRFGDQSGYCYRNAVNYTTKISDNSDAFSSPTTFNSAVYPSWAAVFAENFGSNNCSQSTQLQGSSGSDPALLATHDNSYWGIAHTALAYAVDLGAPGAAQAWQRYVSASNYAPSNFGNKPLWGVVPR